MALFRIKFISNKALNKGFQVFKGADSCNGVQVLKYDLTTFEKLSNLLKR